ncbi:CBO0543 family protein [Salicibibacter cibarius]|nr:CBO0543 family protein [Salicibibacter cibarius]
MKGNKVDQFVLRGTLIITVICLPILILRKKSSIKDWLLAYLFNGITNGIIDNVLASYKILEYPVRHFPNLFRTSLLFDYLVYPTFTIFFNQWTDKDKPKTIVFKLLALTIPANLCEWLIENKTNLVEWNKGWTLRHSFLSSTLKSLMTKSFVVFVRKVSDKQHR